MQNPRGYDTNHFLMIEIIIRLPKPAEDYPILDEEIECLFSLDACLVPHESQTTHHGGLFEFIIQESMILTIFSGLKSQSGSQNLMRFTPS
jgi:hypothetical protein